MLPVSHKPFETNQFFQVIAMPTHSICDDTGAADDWGSRGRHLRSNEVKIRFSPIICDRMEVETRKWCQTTLLVKPLRKMCILIFLGLDLTLTWPDMSNFEINLLRSKSTCVEPARRAKHDGIIFIFVSLNPKKLANEKPSPWNTIIFHLMTSGAKTVDLRSNLFEKCSWGMEIAIQCFFYILPSYNTLGVYSHCLRKSYFHEIWPLATSGGLNIGLTLKWPL